MDRQDVIFIALKVLLETQREEKRRMEESLRADQVALVEKVRERSMLMRKKQGLLEEEAAKEKLVDDFMVFIGAIENDDLETAQNFDEKAMINTILTTMNSDGGDSGGLGCGNGDDVPKTGLDNEEKATMETTVAVVNSDGNCGDHNGGFAGDYGEDVPKIGLGLEEKATMDAIVAMVNNSGSCGGDNGGFTGEYGDDVPKIKLGIKEKATMDKIVAMVNSDGSCGGDNGGFAGDYGDDVPKIKLGLEEKATMDTIVAMVNSDDSCGGDNEGVGGDYGAGGINNDPVNVQSLGEGAIMAAIEGTNSDGSEGRNAGGYGSSCDGNRRK